MSKYYKAEDVLALFSEEERPLNWTDSEGEIQARNDFDYYKGAIESLPTIEVSEYADKDEAFMKGYAKGNVEGYVSGRASVEASEDCVSRANLIKSFLADCECKSRKEARAVTLKLEDMLELIDDAPSVIPKLKEGEWIYTSDQSGYIGNPVEKCSVCGVEYKQAPFNYCPNCGCDMRGGSTNER